MKDQPKEKLPSPKTWRSLLRYTPSATTRAAMAELEKVSTIEQFKQTKGYQTPDRPA